jgi:CheY-like chemotaxis protein
LRVLVVDDETDAREMVNATLTQSGAEVRESSSVAEALEMIEEWHPDVLMSDIGMPDEDGYALIRKVRSLSQERGGGTPAAALTAYAREEDRRLALAAGFHVHLSKPVGRGELITTVADLAGR